MNTMGSHLSFPRRQGGAVLLTSLVILLVLTLIGVSTMDTTGLEMKMASNNRNAQWTFQMAEAALEEAETVINSVGFTDDELAGNCSTDFCFQRVDDDGNSANGVTCGDIGSGAENRPYCEALCINGYCSNADFDGTDRMNCDIYPGETLLWEDETLDVWNTSGRHITANIAGVESQHQPLYIIEFMCFVDSISGEAVATGVPVPFFRVTTLAHDKTGNNPVMLQSTYRGN